MSTPTLKTEKAREIVKLFGHNTNKTSLARMLKKENPLIYDNIEQARSAIKYVTGNAGNRDKKKLLDKSLVMVTKRKNLYGLGEEMHNDITPYIIPSSQKKIGVISDIHIPYQTNSAVTLALNYLKDKKVDTIVLNGDIMDSYQASSFVKDPNMRDLNYEMDATRAFLQAVRKEFPKVLIIYKEGNHELRWKRMLMKNAPEVFKKSEFRLDIILRLAELGIIWVDNKKIIKAGKLNIIHGHEYFSSYSPVNPAKGYYNKALANVLAGHNHQVSSHISKDINDEITGAWSVGCLCDLQPDYAPFNKWQHGFALVKIEKGGNFTVINKMILNGKID